MEPTSLLEIGEGLKEPFSPFEVCTLDDYHIVVVKFEGSYRRHRHNRDEFFYVLKGTLEIEMEREGSKETRTLKEGQCAVVRKGVVHRTSSPDGAIIALVEHRAISYEFLS